MNLDEQLRAALDLEAEMQNAPAPDVDRLISGGRDRRRRRNTTRFGIAAAIVAVLVGVGVYGVMQLDLRERDRAGPAADRPSESATTAPPLPDRRPTARARHDVPDARRRRCHRRHPRRRPDGRRIGLDQRELSGHDRVPGDGGVAAYQPLALAAGSGCTGDDPNTNVGQTPEALVQQLAQLPRSTVVQPPKPTEAFGHDAIHLRYGSTTTARGTRATALRRRNEAVTGSTTASAPRTSSSTSGSWTSTGLRSWSRCGTTRTRRASCWTRSPGPGTRSPS